MTKRAKKAKDDPNDFWLPTLANNPHRVKRKKRKAAKKKPDAVAKQYGFTRNPFKSLTGSPNQVGKEFLLHVYWSGLDDGGDDGRGHLMQRGKVTCDMGLENFPDPPPTDEEMQRVMFAAKIALARLLRTRKRAKR